jgi:CxxC-x17-CxxC domain-containing protein
MNNFKPGGLRHRKDDLGGRPRSDADYSTKGRFDKKPRFESRGNGGGNRYENRGPKDVQLFAATCTTCGKSCEVPFRPDGTKPVLCRDCFAQKNASPSNGGNFERRERTDERKPERSYEAPRVPVTPGVTKAELVQLTSQIIALEAKVTELLVIVKSNQTKQETVKTPEVSEAAPVKKKTVKVKKEAVAKKAVKKVAKK